MYSETMPSPVADGEAPPAVEAAFLRDELSLIGCRPEHLLLCVPKNRPFAADQLAGDDDQLMPTVRTSSRRCC